MWDFPKITTIWSQDIYFVVDMGFVDKSHWEACIVMYLRENRFDHLIL